MWIPGVLLPTKIIILGKTPPPPFEAAFTLGISIGQNKDL